MQCQAKLRMKHSSRAELRQYRIISDDDRRYRRIDIRKMHRVWLTQQQARTMLFKQNAPLKVVLYIHNVWLNIFILLSKTMYLFY